MNSIMRPLTEIAEQATAILIRELGVVDTHRFLSQMRPGTGNYTEERGQWLDDLSLDQITSAIKAKRPKRGRANG